ncbi:Sec-independent protein translocase protein TatB [Falsiroseomonas tokyonensis]|uniref:Sec-independent protein translocase protein TatB n=1 Tax=Falsiroseomonas tokyonensis TaxID=430521 RepID=A0ABV7BWM9_9PROT|nr:Sec-independent protein translocase protein TatB [Falsiroseomonas tokyonensis]MBU8540083.1 twin-arginine translocase subunit TatB [Falsiroseomonas tokyonensis]
MLGLDWTELALIAVVAVVVIGPKDLPDAVRSIAKGIQKLRRMAGEFQGQVDEVVREAKLEDVRNQINEIRSFNVRDIVEKEFDKDGSIRKTFTEDPIGNPLRDAFAPDPAHGATVTPPPVQAGAPVVEAGPPVPTVVPPAFIPPGATPPPAPLAASQPAPPPAPPAFVPPPAPPSLPPSGASAS